MNYGLYVNAGKDLLLKCLLVRMISTSNAYFNKDMQFIPFKLILL